MQVTTIRTRIIRRAVQVAGHIQTQTIAAWSAGDLRDPIHEQAGAIVVVDGDSRSLRNWGHDVPSQVVEAFATHRATHRATLEDGVNSDTTMSHDCDLTIEEMVI